MSKSEKLFSSALGGFKKSEVVEYIEELNRKAKVAKEQYEFEISRLEAEVSELEEKTVLFEETKEKLASCEDKNRHLEDDVENQKNVISFLTEEKERLSARVSELEKDYYVYKEKAEKYDADRVSSVGILERAKTEAVELLEKAKREAAEQAEKVKAESDRLLSENIKKVKYLYKRRDELLAAFEKVKNAAGGFYENIANTLSKPSDD